MPYKFFADESCPDPVADALEQAGFDIQRSVETMRSATDDAVLAAAVAQGRIVIAQDRDFGELIMRRGHASRRLRSLAPEREELGAGFATCRRSDSSGQ